MLTDRKRTEAALFPVWLVNILNSGVNEDKRDEDYHRCQDILAGAVDEAFRGLEDRKRAALLRRVARVHNAITEDYRRNKVSVDKIGLICLYALQAILESGYLELDEGSPLSSALTAIIGALSDAFAEARLDASARKHAGKLLVHLQREGYFDGVSIRREAA